MMSQLSRAAEVVWLLELTATIRPNAVVMSVAEEAGITHLKKHSFKDELIRQTVLGETWAFSDICQLHTKPLFPPLPEEKSVLLS